LIDSAPGIFSAGLLLGLQHSLEPDHVAAVSTLVSREKSPKVSARIGLLWGIGHTSTLLVVGILVFVFKINISAAVSAFFELLVGVMLVYLGLLLIKGAWLDEAHIHPHEHDGAPHTHFHSHKTKKGHAHTHKPLLIGAMHGLAGSAGIIVLVIASMESLTDGLLFIVLFGLGATLGMAGSGIFISAPVSLAPDKPLPGKLLMGAAAAISVFIGIKTIIENWTF